MTTDTDPETNRRDSRPEATNHQTPGMSAEKAVKIGIALCLVSTLMYSLSNVTMRELGVLGYDRSWIVFLKEMCCIVSVSPWILYWAIRRKYQWPVFKWVLCILVGGFFCQYVGARLHLAAFATVGLVVSVPLIQASSMVCSSVFGRIFLREKIIRRCLMAMLLLLVAMCFLVMGPGGPQTSTNPPGGEQGDQHIVSTTPDEPITSESQASDSQVASLESPNSLSKQVMLFGALGAVVAGLAYSVHVVCLRVTSAARQMPVTLIAVQVTGIGAAIFGFEFLRDHGGKISAIWENVSPWAWFLIVSTGLLNTVGFLFQIYSLRYTLVARAQMISVAQIVICTLFGILAYREPTNLMIWLGISLTVSGIYFASTPDKKELSQ